MELTVWTRQFGTNLQKTSESNVKKRYRTKFKGGSRLSANDIMTRENIVRFQDTYAEAMDRLGL